MKEKRKMAASTGCWARKKERMEIKKKEKIKER
jgi:hypothetical protein